MAKKKPGKPLGDGVAELGVTYGNVNFGDKTVRLGISFGTGSLAITKMRELLVGRRLTVHILARAGGAQASQESLPGADNDLELQGVCDVKSVSVAPKHYTTGLTFNIQDMDIETLAHFAKREGVVTIAASEAIPEDEADGEE